MGDGRFTDRRDAGRALARALAVRRGEPGLLVLGLPRGGVVVAAEVAHALGAPLDAVPVAKLGAPGAEELAIGAIAADGSGVVNPQAVAGLGLSRDDVARMAERARERLARSARAWRGDRPPPSTEGRTVLLVDDGLATGATMRAAIGAVRAGAPGRVVVAVPVGAPETCAALRGAADEVVCLLSPSRMMAVGRWYDEFGPTPDDEVRALLAAGA